MVKVRWSPHALEDYYKLYAFLKAKNETAARDSSKAIEGGVELLEEFPELGKPIRDKLKQRELFINFGVGSYVIRHKYADDTIFVVRIWHSKENRDS